MPIQVRTPDGGVAEFPDGMSDEAIAAVLAREFGGAPDGPPQGPVAPDVGYGPGVRPPDASTGRGVDIWVGGDQAAPSTPGAPPVGPGAGSPQQGPEQGAPPPPGGLPMQSPPQSPSDPDRLDLQRLIQAGVGAIVPGYAAVRDLQDGGARAFSTGVPVLGGWADEFSGAMNAALAPGVEPVLHALPQRLQHAIGYDPRYDLATPGATFGDRYRTAVAWDRQLNESARAAHPGAYGAGMAAGTLGGLVLGAGALSGALPETAGLIPRMAVAGAEGAGLGAAQGAGDANENSRAMGALQGGAVGGAFGAAIPAAVTGLGALWRSSGGKAIDALRGLAIPVERPQIDAEALARGLTADAGAIDVPAMAERVPRDLAEVLLQRNATPTQPVASSAVDDAYARIARALERQGQTPQEAVSRVQALGPQGMLADSGEAARDLLRNAANRPGKAGSIAKEALDLRQQGLREGGQFVTRPSSSRILDDAANKMGLGDGTFHQELTALDDAMREAAKPFYDLVREYGPVSSPKLEALAQRPSVKEAMKRAYRIAREDGKDPEALGLVDVENMDQWASSAPDNAAAVQAAQKVRGPANAPTQGKSLAKFIADGGGVRDPGGEFAAMDAQLWNKGKAFQRRLIGEGGAAEDWAQRAWEQGYFPDLTEAPTEQQLREAIRAELAGKPRYARAPEEGAAQRYAAREAADEMVYRGGPNNAPSPEDYVGRPEPTSEPAYQMQPTLEAWDYVKQGLDDYLESFRSDITGRIKLDTETSRIKNTVQELRNELIRLSGGKDGVYKHALDAYAGPASAKTALLAGRNALKLDGEVIEQRFGDMTSPQQQMYRLGAYQALKDRLGNADVTYDAARTAGLLKPNQLERFREIFPTKRAFSDFVQTLENERTMFATRQAALGNSSTAKQLAHMADEDESSFVEGALQAGVNAKTGNVMGLVQALGRLGSPAKLREPTADALAQVLTDMSPDRFPVVVDRLTAAQKRQAVLDALRRSTATAGAPGAASAAERSN